MEAVRRRRASAPAPREQTRTEELDPVRSRVVELQQSAGNTAVSRLLRAPAATATPTAATAEAGGAGAAAQDLLADTVKNAVENYVEDAIPPAKLVILAAKLGTAFAEGAGAALVEANKKLSAQYEEDVRESAPAGGTEGLTEKNIEHLQHIRRSQANSVGELNGILKAGLISMGKQALSELSEVAAEKAFEAASEKLLEATSDKIVVYIQDRVTGEFTSETLFVGAPQSQVRQFAGKVGSEITKAFAQAAASYGVEKKLWPAMETAARLKEAGVPANIADEAARAAAPSVGFEGLKRAVEEKAQLVVARWRESPEWRRQRPELEGMVRTALSEFSSAYEELAGLKKEYSWVADIWLWRTEKATQLRRKAEAAVLEALGPLSTLNHLLTDFSSTGQRFAGDLSFDPEIAAVRDGVADLL